MPSCDCICLYRCRNLGLERFSGCSKPHSKWRSQHSSSRHPSLCCGEHGPLHKLHFLPRVLTHLASRVQLPPPPGVTTQRDLFSETYILGSKERHALGHLAREVEQVTQLQRPPVLLVQVWGRERHQGSPADCRPRPPAPPRTQQPLSSPSALGTSSHLAQRMSHLTKKWTQVSSPRRCRHPGWRSRCPCRGEGPIIPSAQLRPRPAT